MASQLPIQARSIYRSILREFPQRPLSSPSPLKTRIRSQVALEPSQNGSKSQIAQAQLDEAEQFIQYLRAQRTYVTLLERYNPGADMSEEERVRLTARKVGMELPIERMEIFATGDECEIPTLLRCFSFLADQSLLRPFPYFQGESIRPSKRGGIHDID
ncbi:hypothetical protein ACO22_01915 [Paracoccidioides brasiliensis]|uniref:Uncharacterized protein n=1 Tax=Paracoccidioides brasiliensis TaxID=121759 RepID=A0A1D2JK96_PARBR|nr:hypothetical protein ACO22_01915 [Paracoccidioides brasiliensis]ODH50634.1 hypothetical protein GX48_03142 [Paracoccidioides brasiliensis]